MTRSGTPEAGKNTGNKCIELSNPRALLRLRQQTRQFAVRLRALRQLLDHPGPRLNLSAGDIGLAGMIDYCPKSRMPPQASLKRAQMSWRHQCIEHEIIYYHCFKRSVERIAVQPIWIANVLDHRSQSFEYSPTVANEAADSLRHITRFKIRPTDNAGNGCILAGKFQ